MDVHVVGPIDALQGTIRVSGWVRCFADAPSGEPSSQIELEDLLATSSDDDGFGVSRARSVYSGDGYGVVPGAAEGAPRTVTFGVAAAGEYRVFVRQVAAGGDARVDLDVGSLHATLEATPDHRWVDLGTVSLSAGEADLTLTPVGVDRLGLDVLVLAPEAAPPPAGSGIDALGSAIDPELAGSSLLDAIGARIAPAPVDLQRDTMRRRFREAFDLEPLPIEPPDHEIVDTISDGPCDLHLLWFDGGHGPVPANLYVPRDAPGPLPAILNPIGHWSQGKALPDEQIRAASFCRLGFVSLTFDTYWQGERAGDADDHFLGTFDALHADPLAGMILGEAVRAVSLLVSLPEVDPDRIGVTGASGGGMQTAFLAAVDDRIAAAAPVVYTTDWEWLVLESHRGDPCQIPFGSAAIAPLPDLVSTFAPRPLLFISAEEDSSFPLSVAERVFDEVQTRYAEAGTPNEVALEIVSGPHGYGAEARRLAFDFFLSRLRGAPPLDEDPSVDPRSAEEIAVHPEGLRSLVEEHERTATSAPTAGQGEEAQRRQMAALSERLDPHTPAGAGARLVSEGGGVARYALDVDGGREVSMLVLGSRAPELAIVVVSDGGMAGSTVAPWIVDMASERRAVVLVEPTGIGTQAGPYRSPRGTSWSFNAGYLGAHPLLVGLTGASMLHAEARAAAEFARRDLGASRVILCGEGPGAGSSAIAIGAVDEPSFDAVASVGGFVSLAAAAAWAEILPPLLVARRLLEVGDLPALAALYATSGRPLFVASPLDSTGRPMPESDLLDAYQGALRDGAPVTVAGGASAWDSLSEWILAQEP